MGRRPGLYRAIGANGGLRVIAGAGTYRRVWLPAWIAASTDEQVAARFLPALRAAGDAVLRRRLLVLNPRRALAFWPAPSAPRRQDEAVHPQVR